MGQLMDYNGNDLVRKVYEQDGLLDILTSFEKFLDDSNLYVYSGWMDGVIVEGPNVSKYWVEIVLMFDGATMPDPRGAKLFERHGVKVSVKKTFQERSIEKPRSQNDMQTIRAGVLKPAVEKVPVILYKFVVPRQLLDFESFDEYKILDANASSDISDSDIETDAPDTTNDDAGESDNFDDLMATDDAV